MESFIKGEKLLMYVIDDDVMDQMIKDPIKYGEYFFHNHGEEVIAESCDNVSGFDIITVRDSNGNRWCGSHIEDYALGRIRFIRKDERIHALKDVYDALYEDLSVPNREERLKRLTDVMCSECDHLFAILKDSDDHELPVMQCVHCGLTNLWEVVKDKDEAYVTHDGKLQLEEFNEYLLRTFGSTSPESTSGMNILSYNAHKFNNLQEAYRMAIVKNPEATKKELFDLMIEIDGRLEHPFKKNRIYPNI